MPEVKPNWSGEVQLMGYGESDSSGCWIKLQVTPEDIEFFRGLKGSCFDCLLANMDSVTGDDIKKGGRMAKEAGKMCKNVSFQVYAAEYYIKKHDKDVPVTEDIARSMILEWCHITSRKELDHDDLAKKRFIGLMSHYHNWTATENVVK